jgi:hypothetical protein
MLRLELEVPRLWSRTPNDPTISFRRHLPMKRLDTSTIAYPIVFLCALRLKPARPRSGAFLECSAGVREPFSGYSLSLRLFLILLVPLGLTLLVACGPADTPTSPSDVTPTPCATSPSSQVPASGVATTGPAARSTPAGSYPLPIASVAGVATGGPAARVTAPGSYPLPGAPTFSASQLATAQARIEGANPGAPTTPAQSPARPCPTLTPAR